MQGVMWTIDQLGQTIMQRDAQIVALQQEIEQLRAGKDSAASEGEQ